MMHEMKAIMNLKALKNTEELQTFLDGAQAIIFSVPGNKTARYEFRDCESIQNLVRSQPLPSKCLDFFCQNSFLSVKYR